MRIWVTLAAISITFLAFQEPAAAFLGTDTSGDYAYSDSLNPTDPDSPTHSFSSIASTGTSGPSGDDSTGTADIGFEFEFYGVLYDSVEISTNGFLTFTPSGDAGCCSGESIPTPGGDIDNFIAGAWEDLSTTGGGIYYQTIGTAPSRRFIVEFEIGYLSGGDVTFQIELVEGSDEIYLHYLTDGDETDTTTIGIENADGSDGIEYLRGGTDSVDLDNQTIVFFPRRDAPRLQVVTEDASVPEGGELELEVTAIDRQGDPVTIEWDTDLDGEYDDGEGETITVSAAGLDGPDVIQLGVRASDDQGHEDARVVELPVTNAPPVLTNVPEEPVVLYVGEEFLFTPEIVDPGGDEVTVEVQDRPMGMVLLPEGGVRWTPNEDDLGEARSVTFYAVDDDDNPGVEGDGDTTAVLTLEVTINRAPEGVRFVKPEDDAVIDTLEPTFEVTTPEDPDGDTVVIRYEVDTSDTFTSDNLIAGEVETTRSTTAWRLDVELEDGERYHVRARAFDGDLEGPAGRVTFTVDLGRGGDGDGDVDGDGDGDGDSDGDGDGDVTVGGCNCQTGALQSQPPTEIALLFLLAAVMIFSRRR